jgi:outer membrane protein assembly factor BamB
MTRYCILAVALVSRFGSPTPAADWPTFRGDAARSGYTTDELPKELSLRWSLRPLHAPQPAWPRSSRIQFDRALQVVIGDGRVYFGSSADGKVYCLDATTGREVWSIFTAAPVRFAPALWSDRVLVASDDGYLYALAAKDGSLLWKRRGGPRDELLLGNDRLVSRWPARGGPVVVDDIVYFAAGIWPSEGIYLYALDPATGKVLWSNDDSGSIYMPQPHGGANAHSGVAAQGYLAAAGERLLVPTGRAVPAAFQRKEGKLDYFHLQRYGQLGGGELVVAGAAFLNSGWLFESQTGEAVQRLGQGVFAATPGGVIQSTATTLASHRFAEMASKDRRGNPRVYRGLTPEFVVNDVPGGASLIVAGKTAVVGGSGAVTLVDLAEKRRTQSLKIDGTAYGLAAADGALYVSTDRGTIYCFAAPGDTASQITREAGPTSPYGDDSPFAEAAAEIVKRSGITEGYCVDLACGDGALAYELARRTKLRIYAVDASEDRVAAARTKLSATGLYGVRVMVHQASPDATRYPNHFANLVVCARTVAEGPAAAPAEEAARLQRPAGGVACFGRPGEMQAAVRAALAGAGAWTHQYANAANTSCSDDKLLKGRLRILWYRDADFDLPQRHGRAPAPLYLDGRLFHEGLNGIRAVDAYNGRTLWEFPLPGILKPYHADHLMGTAGTGSNMCVAGDSLYVRHGDRCFRIAAADGRKLAEFTVPAASASKREKSEEQKGIWGYLACEDGLLFGSLVDEQHVVRHSWKPADMSELFTESTALFALDARTGEPRWSYRAKHSIRHNAIAIGGGRVYLIDRPQAEGDRPARRGERPLSAAAPHGPGTLLALDAATGNVVWKQDKEIYGTLLALSTRHNALLMSYQPTRFKLPSEQGGRLGVFRTDDGRRLWDKTAKYETRPMINDLTVYAHGGAWDLLTGEQRPFQLTGKSYGCGQLSGCESLLFYRSATLGYFDLSATSLGTQNFGGIRPGCWINAIPAGGIVLVPDAASGCVCSYLNQAWMALEPGP